MLDTTVGAGAFDARRAEDATLKKPLAYTKPLTCTLSPYGGEAGPSMQRFINEHVTCILQPITEHIQELQDKMQVLTQDLGNTDARVYGYLGKLEAHEKDLHELRTGHADTGEALRGLRAELAGTGERHAALERHHNETRGDLGRTARSLKTTAASLEQLQHALGQAVEESSSSLKQLREELTAVSGRTARVQESFARLDTAHRDLADVVRESLTPAIQEAKDLGGLNARHLEKIAATVDSNREDHERLLGDLRQTDHRLEQDLRGAREALESALAAGLTGLRAEAVAASRRTGTLEEDLKALRGEVQVQRKVLKDQLRDLEVELSDLSTRLGNLQTASTGAADALEAPQTVGGNVKQQAGTLRHLLEADERRGHHLQSLAGRVAGLEDRTAGLTQRMDISESRLKACEATQREAAGALDTHRLELDRSHQRQQQMSTSLGGATANLRIVGDQLRSVGHDVARHAMRLDLAHEYIDGMGKGFQDTHRSVLTGQDGLLPPKSGSLTGRGLPRIVRSGQGGEGRETALS